MSNGSSSTTNAGTTKIAVVHWGSSGGGPSFSVALGRALKDAEGAEVVFSRSTEVDNAPAWDAVGVATHTITTYRSAAGALFGVVRLPREVIRFRRFLRDHDIHAVIAPMFSLWQSIAPRLLVGSRRLYIAAIHDASEHPGDESWLKRWCRKADLRAADAIMTFSSHVSEQLRTHTSKPIFELKHGVSACVQSSRTPPKDTVRLGFYGRILPYKGLPLFVEAIRLLRAKGMNVTGHVMGRGVVPRELMEDSEAITWSVGWASEESTKRFFRTTDVVVLPYIEASQSGVVAQAIGWATPTVATPVGGLAQQIAMYSTGVVSDHVDAHSVASAVSTLVGDPELYQQLSMNAYRAATTDLAWSSIANELLSQVSTLFIDRNAP